MGGDDGDGGVPTRPGDATTSGFSRPGRHRDRHPGERAALDGRRSGVTCSETDGADWRWIAYAAVAFGVVAVAGTQVAAGVLRVDLVAPAGTRGWLLDGVDHALTSAALTVRTTALLSALAAGCLGGWVLLTVGIRTRAGR